MSKNKKYTNEDARDVFLAIAYLCDSTHRYDVRLSIDQEYFILSCNGNDIVHDSACDDCYNISDSIAFFESFIIERESHE